jgi:prophage DNA circulation protein
VNETDYQSARDTLIAALESDDGPGQLIHPLLGVDLVQVENYTVIERKEAGGYCEFDIEFVEAGQQTYSQPTTDTKSQSNAAAQKAIGDFPLSSDIQNLA